MDKTSSSCGPSYMFLLLKFYSATYTPNNCDLHQNPLLLILPAIIYTVKIIQIWTPENVAVVTLKFEQDSFAKE